MPVILIKSTGNVHLGKVVISIRKDMFVSSPYIKTRDWKKVLVFLFPLLLFIVFAVAVLEKKLSFFDDAVYQRISGIASGNMTYIMRLLTFLGNWQVMVGITLAGILLYWKSSRYAFASRMLGVNLTICWFLNEVLKYGFRRERPGILHLTEATGYSFPSGHSMVSMGFYGFIAFVVYFSIRSRWKYLYIGGLGMLILLIGFSRVYLGVHYASDVLAGFFAGFTWLTGFCSLMGSERLFPARGRETGTA